MLAQSRNWYSVFSFLIFLNAAALFGQGDGALRGLIRDPTGAAIPGAQVTAENQETGVTALTESSGVGSYQFTSLLLGRYTVSVKANGFKEYVRGGVEVHAGQIAEANADLEIGNIENRIEVVSGEELISTTSSQLGAAISDKVILELPNPVLGGNPLNLAVLYPNTTTQGGGQIGRAHV